MKLLYTIEPSEDTKRVFIKNNMKKYIFYGIFKLYIKYINIYYSL